jgi:ABC-type multidrug transport system ATPase subunit
VAVSKRFGSYAALRDVDVRVVGGEVVVLLGPNGSGKTTLLNVVAGLLAQDAGTVRVGGAPAGSRAARRLVALVPDEPRGLDELTVVEHVSLMAALAGVPSTTGLSALERFGLAAVLDERIGGLSRGERRRAAVAAALAAEPRLLLVDEATSTLDRTAVEAMAQVLRNQAACGGAALVATHDLPFARAVSDRALLLSRGAIVGGGPPGCLELLEHLHHDGIAGGLGGGEANDVEAAAR